MPEFLRTLVFARPRGDDQFRAFVLRMVDGHRISTDLPGALADDDLAGVNAQALGLVHLGSIGLEAEGLLLVAFQGLRRSRGDQAQAQSEAHGQGPG